jgi:hypothetical protein
MFRVALAIDVVALPLDKDIDIYGSCVNLLRRIKIGRNIFSIDMDALRAMNSTL